VKQLNVLLVNPWIYDFTAYDLWAKPLGLLYIAGILQKYGYNVTLIDCMDRHHPGMKAVEGYTPKSEDNGCGQYYTVEVNKPATLAQIPRKYHRIGMPENVFVSALSSVSTPDIILVTSGMTYWYQGVKETVEVLKKMYPGKTIIIGGTYATLCYNHAVANLESGMVKVYKGGDLAELIKIVHIVNDIEPPMDAENYTDFRNYPAPWYDAYMDPLLYIAYRTSIGCINRCTYCGVNQLAKVPRIKAYKTVVDELRQVLYKRQVRNVAFYDDALFQSANRAEEFLSELVLAKLDGYKYHTPNGLAPRMITKSVALLMKRVGFIRPRLSFESSNPITQKNSGDKINNFDFENAVQNLITAGYPMQDIGVYVLAGLPYEGFDDVKRTIQYIGKMGIEPILVEYSPIPGTPDWAQCGFPPNTDPVWHNNTAYHFLRVDMGTRLQELKDLAHSFWR